MQQIDWTAVIVALVGSGGLLVAIVSARFHAKRPKSEKRADDAAHAAAQEALLIPSSHDARAITLAQSAMDQAGAISDRLLRTEARLSEVEEELGKFRKSYLALYAWAKRVVFTWDELRQRPDPPELPDDIHHP